MAVLRWKTAKDPNAVVDYHLDWSNRIGEDTIATSTWTQSGSASITVNSNTYTNTVTTIWVSGGTAGAVATFLNRITTAGGRTFDQSIALRVEEQ